MPEEFFKYLLLGGGALSLLAAVNFKEKVGELLSKSITEKPQQVVSNENKTNDVESCPFEIKVTYSNNNTLGKIEIISANNITPFHVQIFNQEDKLFLNGHGKEFLASSNYVDNVDTEIYAVVKDRYQKEVKTTFSHLYLKKRLDLVFETNVSFQQFESMLVKKITFKLLIAGGMKEGKSATFKSIKKLLEKSGYFAIGNAPIHSNSSKKSVTRSVYSYKFQKTINNTPVEIEVIDTPGLWDTPHMDSTEPISFNSRTMLERVMRGSVKNGATEEQILNDTPLPHLVDKIPTPDVLITCFNHSQMLNGFSHKRFEKLKEISEDIGNCPIVLALTWFDEKIDQESSDCERYMFNGTEFKKLESEEDLYYSNFNESIKKLLPLDVEYLPIINTDSESVKHLELASRRQLSEYFLVQLLNYAILKVDATN